MNSDLRGNTVARKAKGNGQPIEETPAPEIDDDGGNTNCSDEVRRDYYRKCLMSKIGYEGALATAKTKLAEHRNNLKAAAKAGVDTDAITAALNDRFIDEDVLVLKLREKLKMLDLAGVVRGIIDKILARISVQEPTRNEAHQTSLDRAYDDGAFGGREGAPRDSNPHVPGSELRDTWDRGWLLGQAAIASEMMPAEPPAVIQ
jgi:hypothetical protein